MAIDYCIGFECAAKRHFGNGDYVAGSTEVLEKLKARNRGRMLALMAQQEGKDPYKVAVTVCLDAADTNGMQLQEQVTLAELEEQARDLDVHASGCDNCPARCIDQAYGCFGCIHYPISAEAENWLMNRMQPSGTIGAEMCLDLITKTGISGNQVSNMRERGLFESIRAPKIALKKSLLNSQSVTADQIFEAMFMVGNPVAPGHCGVMLLSFGALMIDGRVLTNLNDEEGLAKLVGLQTAEDKARCTQQVLGPPSNSEEIAAFESYFRAMYLAWLYNLPLYVSA